MDESVNEVVDIVLPLAPVDYDGNPIELRLEVCDSGYCSPRWQRELFRYSTIVGEWICPKCGWSAKAVKEERDA